MAVSTALPLVGRDPVGHCSLVVSDDYPPQDGEAPGLTVPTGALLARATRWPGFYTHSLLHLLTAGCGTQRPKPMRWACP
jgi:hypothetical protein